MGMGRKDAAGADSDSAGAQAASKGIQIKVVVPSPFPEVYGDPERLQQILLNYLSNGVKFTPVRRRCAATPAPPAPPRPAPSRS
eukprot:tig00020563_g11224.t1